MNLDIGFERLLQNLELFGVPIRAISSTFRWQEELVLR